MPKGISSSPTRTIAKIGCGLLRLLVRAMKVR